MTGEELRAARMALGMAWGLDRPLHMGEMQRACGLASQQSIRDYESGRSEIRGPLARLVGQFLDGAWPAEDDRPEGFAPLERNRWRITMVTGGRRLKEVIVNGRPLYGVQSITQSVGAPELAIFEVLVGDVAVFEEPEE